MTQIFNIKLECTPQQLFQLGMWCMNNGITYLEGENQVEEEQPTTPITNTHIGTIADLWGCSLNHVLEVIERFGATSVEDALQKIHNAGSGTIVPQPVIEYLESIVG